MTTTVSAPSRRLDVGRLLPVDAARYTGLPFALWGLGLYDILWTGRSLVHMLAPDGGAQSIATIDTDVAGGDNIIALFGQWGAVQLLLAAIVWVVVWRYRGLVPLMLLVVLVEPMLRIGVGQLKPLTAVGTPPGAVADYVVLPLLAVLLLASLTGRRTSSLTVVEG